MNPTVQRLTDNSFDIRNHIEKLQQSERKGRYVCPVCGGNNLTINSENGAYKCWTNECESSEIRNAVAPLGVGDSTQPIRLARPKPQYKPVAIPEGATLLTADGLGNIPQMEIFEVGANPPKGTPKGAQRRITYYYSDCQGVNRYEIDDSRESKKGYKKEFRPWHIEDGEVIYKKGDRAWFAYRLAEAIYHIERATSTPALLWGEGEKCVEIARESGIVSCTFNGSGWSEKEITASLQQIKEADPQTVQVFLADSDDAGKRKAEKFQKCCNKLKIPCIVVNTSLFEVEGDVEQIFESMSVPEFIRRLEAEIHGAATSSSAADVDEGDDECKLVQKYNSIKAAWGDRLRWNSMKKRVEMDGSPLPLDRIKLRIAKELRLDIGREDAVEVILDLAQDNEYSPFKEYLEALPNGNPELLNTLAARFLGTHDPLHQVLLKRTLIAAVARTYQPGCKHDTICILKGKQGALKSTFWSVLAGEDNFTDDLSGTDKDEILKLSQYAMIEFSEFETAYKKKEVSALKAFLSRKSDSIRVPYGRDIQDIPRPSIFVGTTNKPEFLHDPTGERRYWAVPVECERIDIPQLKVDRDAIWSAAKAAYLADEQWWLTLEEDEMLNASNSDFASTDVWEDAISGYVSFVSEVSVREILAECLKIDLANHDRASQMRVSEILTRLGWVKGKKKKIDARTVQVWNKPIQKCNLKVATEVATGVATEVATTSNVDIAMHSNNEVATVATFSQNLDFKSQQKSSPDENFNSTQQSFEKGGSNREGSNQQMQSQSDFNQVATSEVATSSKTEIKENSIVYPTVGKHRNKECKVSAITNGFVWAYRVSQADKPATQYKRSEFSLTPLVDAEEEASHYCQSFIDWNTEEYLEGDDD